MTSSMKNIKPRQSQRYLSSDEPHLFIDKFIGIDLDTPHQSMKPGYFKDLLNLDLFENGMRTRRGWAVSNAENNFDGVLMNGVVWDTGDDDIAVFCLKDAADANKVRFYYKNLTTLGAFDKVYILGTGSGEQVELTVTEPPDMLVLNDRIYVTTTQGNFIIEVDTDPNPTNKYTMRSFGLTAPASDFYTLAAGTMTGDYVFGLELVYQVSGVDLVASTPERHIFDSPDLLKVTLYNQKITIHVESTSLPSGGGVSDYWTHVRVYQSRRLDRDLSNPSNPVGPFGTDAELYPVALITKADLIAATYNVEVNVNDNAMDLTEVWEYDRIELSPLPAAYTLAYHKARLYVSGCATVDPTESIIYYSNFAGTKYSEQYNALQNIPVAAGDGKKIRKLLSLNSDLVVFKEVSTFVCQNGDVDLPPVVVDKSIGLSSHRLAQYIPKLGLCAITSDNYDFKIFDESRHWTNVYNKLEISRLVRSKMRTYAALPNQVSMYYINGKLHIGNGGIAGVSEVLVLHVEQGLGWSRYTYPVSTSQFMFTYANNSRAGIIAGAGQVQMEIEIFDTYVDSPAVNPFDIPITIQTHMFQSNNGQDLLEMHKLMISSTLDETGFTGTAYVNGTAWQSVSNTAFKPDPTSLLSSQRGGLYELYLSKRPIYPWIYCIITSAGNISIDFMKWVGIINKDLALNYLNRVQSASLPVIVSQPQNYQVII